VKKDSVMANVKKQSFERVDCCDKMDYDMLVTKTKKGGK
jgi:hypothetical protein